MPQFPIPNINLPRRDPFKSLEDLIASRRNEKPEPEEQKGILELLLPALAEAVAVGTAQDPGAALGGLLQQRRERQARDEAFKKEQLARKREQEFEAALRIGLEKAGQEVRRSETLDERFAREREARARREFEAGEGEKERGARSTEAKARRAFELEQQKDEQRFKEEQFKIAAAENRQNEFSEQKGKLMEKGVPAQYVNAVTEFRMGLRDLTPDLQKVINQYVGKDAELDRRYKAALINQANASAAASLASVQQRKDLDKQQESARKELLQRQDFFTNQTYYKREVKDPATGQVRTEILGDNELTGVSAIEKTLKGLKSLTPEENAVFGRMKAAINSNTSPEDFKKYLDLQKNNPQFKTIVDEYVKLGYPDALIIQDLKSKGKF